MLHWEADSGLLEKGTTQSPEHSLTSQPQLVSIFPGELHLLQGMGGPKPLILCSKRIYEVVTPIMSANSHCRQGSPAGTPSQGAWSSQLMPMEGKPRSKNDTGLLVL